MTTRKVSSHNLIEDDKNKKDNKKTTDSYAGGQSSGINIENPDDKEKKDDMENFQKQENRIKLTAYKNGFQIDDGEFRDLADPVNKKFMDEVNKGYIPQELVNKGYKNLGIAMEDKK